MSSVIASTVVDARAVLQVLYHLSKHDQLSRHDLVNALDMLTDSIDEIDQVNSPIGGDVPAAGMKRLPVMTLADIAREARTAAASARRPSLIVINGGQA